MLGPAAGGAEATTVGRRHEDQRGPMRTLRRRHPHAEHRLPLHHLSHRTKGRTAAGSPRQSEDGDVPNMRQAIPPGPQRRPNMLSEMPSGTTSKFEGGGPQLESGFYHTPPSSAKQPT